MSSGRRESRAPLPTFTHDALNSFLAQYVDQEGRLNYAQAIDDRADLDLYLDQIASVSPDSKPRLFPSEDSQLAYWINAYNASVIGLVLDQYPLASVQDVRAPWLFRFLPEGAGFFVFNKIRLGQKKTRIYTLENGLIRRRFKDPRIHFALNCASASCPRLPAEAFDADRLEEQLARETVRFLSEERNIELDEDSNTLRLSAIFNWYETDFPRGLRNFLLDHGTPELRHRLRSCSECTIEFKNYDWSLNDRTSA